MTDIFTEDDFDEQDREALQRSLDLTLMGGDQEAITRACAILATEGWFKSARDCCHSRQDQHLLLRPWEAAPSEIDSSDIDAIILRGPTDREYGAAKLLRQMIRYGVSRYDPEPIDAIAAAKRKV